MINIADLIAAMGNEYYSVKHSKKTTFKSNRTIDQRLAFYSIGNDNGTFEHIYLSSDQNIIGEYLLTYCETRQGFSLKFIPKKFKSGSSSVMYSEDPKKEITIDFKTVEELSQRLSENFLKTF